MSAPVTYTPEQMVARALMLENACCCDEDPSGRGCQCMEAAAMLRQAAAEGQGKLRRAIDDLLADMDACSHADHCEFIAAKLRAAIDATHTEPTPPPVPRCGTCKHFGTAVGLVEPLVGHCSRNHSYGWPADGSGYCHLHPDAQPVTGGDR